MAANDASERSPAQGVLMLVAGAALSVLSLYLLQRARVGALETGAIASTEAALPATIGNAAFNRRRGLRSELPTDDLRAVTALMGETVDLRLRAGAAPARDAAAAPATG